MTAFKKDITELEAINSVWLLSQKSAALQQTPPKNKVSLFSMFSKQKTTPEETQEKTSTYKPTKTG